MFSLRKERYRSSWKKGFFDFSGVRKSTDRLHGYLEDLRDLTEEENLDLRYAEVREPGETSRYDDISGFVEDYTGNFCSYHELKDVEALNLEYQSEEETVLSFNYRKDCTLRDSYSLMVEDSDLADLLSGELDISFRRTFL